MSAAKAESQPGDAQDTATAVAQILEAELADLIGALDEPGQTTDPVELLRRRWRLEQAAAEIVEMVRGYLEQSHRSAALSQPRSGRGDLDTLDT